MSDDQVDADLAMLDKLRSIDGMTGADQDYLVGLIAGSDRTDDGGLDPETLLYTLERPIEIYSQERWKLVRRFDSRVHGPYMSLDHFGEIKPQYVEALGKMDDSSFRFFVKHEPQIRDMDFTTYSLTQAAAFIENAHRAGLMEHPDDWLEAVVEVHRAALMDGAVDDEVLKWALASVGPAEVAEWENRVLAAGKIMSRSDDAAKAKEFLRDISAEHWPVLAEMDYPHIVDFDEAQRSWLNGALSSTMVEIPSRMLVGYAANRLFPETTNDFAMLEGFFAGRLGAPISTAAAVWGKDSQKGDEQYVLPVMRKILVLGPAVYGEGKLTNRREIWLAYHGNFDSTSYDALTSQYFGPPPFFVGDELKRFRALRDSYSQHPELRGLIESDCDPRIIGDVACLSFVRSVPEARAIVAQGLSDGLIRLLESVKLSPGTVSALWGIPLSEVNISSLREYLRYRDGFSYHDAQAILSVLPDNANASELASLFEDIRPTVMAKMVRAEILAEVRPGTLLRAYESSLGSDSRQSFEKLDDAGLVRAAKLHSKMELATAPGPSELGLG